MNESREIAYIGSPGYYLKDKARHSIGISAAKELKNRLDFKSNIACFDEPIEEKPQFVAGNIPRKRLMTSYEENNLKNQLLKEKNKKAKVAGKPKPENDDVQKPAKRNLTVK